MRARRVLGRSGALDVEGAFEMRWWIGFWFEVDFVAFWLFFGLVEVLGPFFLMVFIASDWRHLEKLSTKVRASYLVSDSFEPILRAICYQKLDSVSGD